MAWSIPTWTVRAALGVFAVLALAWVVLGWLHANALRSEFLDPASQGEDTVLEIIANEAGRITVPRTPETVREGVWGVDGGSGYVQMDTIVRITEDAVERGARTLDGQVPAGALTRLDSDAWTGDPQSAHSIGFEELVVPADIGPHDAWFVDGRRATWIVFVHGRGDDRLGESLRILPGLVEQGFPVMVTSYRNDVGATASDSGMRLWGLEEWRDVEAAVQLAVRKGALDVVLIGSGFGSSLVSMFLHESPEIGVVRGAIYESPLLDLEAVAREWAAERSTPRIVAWLGRRLATLRFGVDWNELDQLERVEEFDVPMLVMTGGTDPVTDPERAARFVEGLGDIGRLVRFEQAAHADLWNVDAGRYERTIGGWLTDLLGGE